MCGLWQVDRRFGDLQSVVVEATDAGVIQTDSQVIQETFTPAQLLNLPANIRANGSTSPYQLIQVLPGVQSDGSGNFSIQGGIQSQTQYSVDGISITDVTGNSPLQQAFPSSESISEIKVQGVGSPAEYGQVGDVTTVSKSGTNTFHGGLFWYTQNAALNALNSESDQTQLIANDYGVAQGAGNYSASLQRQGPRHFSTGLMKAFILRAASVVQNIVPTKPERSGKFSAGVTPSIRPPVSHSSNMIPTGQHQPDRSGLLQLYPDPNAGNPNVASANNSDCQ